MKSRKITICLWFDEQGEQAARFYTGIFPKSRIGLISRYRKSGHPINDRMVGKVMVVAFTLNGQEFTALNGGPMFKFNEAISLQVMCADQKELDYYWSRLSRGGDKRSQRCGWLKDKFGVSWQIVPAELPRLMTAKNPAKAERVMHALMGMRKLDIAKLRRAYAGK